MSFRKAAAAAALVATGLLTSPQVVHASTIKGGNHSDGSTATSGGATAGNSTSTSGSAHVHQHHHAHSGNAIAGSKVKGR